MVVSSKSQEARVKTFNLKGNGAPCPVRLPQLPVPPGNPSGAPFLLRSGRQLHFCSVVGPDAQCFALDAARWEWRKTHAIPQMPGDKGVRSLPFDPERRLFVSLSGLTVLEESGPRFLGELPTAIRGVCGDKVNSSHIVIAGGQSVTL